jgi:hypothetical protein
VPKDPLDIREEPGLVDADQRDRVAVDAGSTRATDAVDVILRDHRQLEVDDMR